MQATSKALKIYTYGASILRKKTQPIFTVNDSIRQLVYDMIHTMYEDDGIGLSANQVGEGISLFVVGSAAFDDERGDSLFLNPNIVDMSEETDIQEEGCLSIPGIRENVARALHIRFTWQDLSLIHHEETFSGYAARVIQHEYDHLQGIFFTDRISSVRKMFIRKKLSEIAASQKAVIA
ncbi:MAG: peptide deformylase [Candidatus Marinimicrobia bacterium]|nr:peptide deformylase [Candidatus Neomarinimicrobiota bacterium]MDD5583327.1 peptide deformylase [Candidatus Neomarinimicrobiota bacterium]